MMSIEQNVGEVVEVRESKDGAGDEAAETSAFLKVVGALRPLPNLAQARVVEAALALLGVRTNQTAPISSPGTADALPSPSMHVGPTDLPRRASVWMAQANLSITDLDSVFHRTSGGVELIAHVVPGRSDKDRVRSCYMLAGIQGLLKTGEPRFDDEDARRICRELGCYNKANHATYVKALGNLVTGTKSTSYELTHPGLRAAAEVMKEIPSLGGTYER